MSRQAFSSKSAAILLFTQNVDCSCLSQVIRFCILDICVLYRYDCWIKPIHCSCFKSLLTRKPPPLALLLYATKSVFHPLSRFARLYHFVRFYSKPSGSSSDEPLGFAFLHEIDLAFPPKSRMRLFAAAKPSAPCRCAPAAERNVILRIISECERVDI